jgi:hypothetical protein
MQKKSLLQFWLLLCLMIAGATHAWAVEVTYKLTISTSDFNTTSYAANNNEKTSNAVCINDASKTYEVKWTSNQVMKNGGMQWQKSNGYIYNSTPLGTIKEVKINSDAGSFTTYYGEEEQPSSSTEVGGSYFMIAVGASATGKTSSIVVTFTIDEVSASPLTSISVDASQAQTVYHVGDTFTSEGAVVTATYEDKSTKNVTSSAEFSEPDMTTSGIKTVTVSYTENEVEKTTSYEIQVLAPATLSSISLSGTYPVEFTQGEEFSSEGIIVTANYDDETAEDVTAEATFSGYDMAVAGTQTVTVSYEGKTTTYQISVAEYIQPTEFDIAFGNSLFNTNYSGSVNGITDSAPVIGNLNNVTVTYAGSGNHYINDSQIRFYPNNKLTFEAPSGYNITSVVFVSGGNWAATIISDEGEYDASNKTWTGEAAKVVFTGSGSGRCDMSKASIILEKIAPKVLASIAVSGEYPTEFYVNEEFSHEGAVVTATYKSGKTEDVTETAVFSVPDMTEAGTKTVTVTYTENEVVKTTTYEITVKVPAVLQSIAVSGEYPTEFSIGDEFSSEGIVVTATFDDQSVRDVTEHATFSGYDLSQTGNQTVTVSYTFGEVEKTATYNITVTLKKGSEALPYTVAEAIDAVDNDGDVTGVYATGIVSQIVTAYNSQYGNISYNISADGTTDGAQLQAFRGKGIDGASFTSEDDIQVGDQVVVYGNLKRYNNIYEFEQGNQLVSLSRKATPTLAFDTEAENYEVLVGGQLTISAAVAEEEYEGTISYSSSDTDVAEIDSSTGVVTANAQGTVTITATAEETENFKGSSVQIQLIVTDPSLANNIVISSAQNGLVEADKEKANEGETVTLTATPAAGYKLTGWTILDGEANEVEYIADGNTATFTMPATAVEVEASFAEIVYHDVMFSVAGQEYGKGARIEDGKTLTFPEDPTVEDFAFAGWSTTNDVTAPEFVTNATVVNEDMILYAMFVAKAGVNEYRKVTATEDITNGEYLIVYEKEGLAFNGALETLDAVGNSVKVKINNGVIASTTNVDAATFTIDVTEGEGTLQSASGYYIGQPSYNNGLASSEETTYSNTFAIDKNGDAVITTDGGCTLRYNDASNQNRFRYYKSGQKAIALYKKTDTTIYFDGTIVDEVALSDTEDYTATTATVAKKVTLTRTVKANTWSSFVVPFNMAKPEGVDLKELSSSEIKEDGTVRLTFTDATAIEAGKPYMMRSDNEITKFSADDAVVLPAAQKQDAATAYVDMVGTYVSTSIPTGDYFFSNNVFKFVGAKPVKTKGFRAYFHLHDVPAAEGEARIVAFGLDDETTGIGGASHLNDKGEMINEVFDLSGRKVAQPTRGLYIVNGKKLFVK